MFILRLIAFAGVPLALAVPVVVALSPSGAGQGGGFGPVVSLAPGIAPTVVAALEAPGCIALAIALLALARFLGAARAGAALSEMALTSVRTFATALVAVAVWSIAKKTMLAALGSPSGSLVLELKITGDQATALLVALTFLVIAAVLRDAVAIKRDHDAFI